MGMLDDNQTKAPARRVSLQAEKDEVLRTMRRLGCSALLGASEELRHDRAFILEAVSTHEGKVLDYAGEDLRADKEFVLEVVKRSWNAFLFASWELQEDWDIVLQAVQQCAAALTCVSQDLSLDHAFVVEAASRNGEILEHVGRNFQRDKKVVLAAVRQYGPSLEYASRELQADREVVLQAVQQSGEALQYASDDLRADELIVFEALKSYGPSLAHASAELQSDEEILLLAARFADNSDYGTTDFIARHKAVMSRERFKRAKESAIAARGEETLVISVVLEYKLGRNCPEAGALLPPWFDCQIQLLSSVGFCVPLEERTYLDPSGHPRPGPTVNDLALKIWTNFRRTPRSRQWTESTSASSSTRTNNQSEYHLGIGIGPLQTSFLQGMPTVFGQFEEQPCAKQALS